MTDFQVPKSQRVCQVESCTESILAKGLCIKHYMQIRRYGKILKRTIYTSNTFIFKDNICVIGLFNKKCKKIAETIIDIADYDIAKTRKWHLYKGARYNYVVSKSNGVYIRLHRLLMNPGYEQDVDHRNHDTLNNRRYNLRVCTKSQNRQNSKTQRNNTSGVKGVHWNKTIKLWQVRINANTICHSIGYFKSFDKAMQEAIKAREKYHHEFACYK